jgi:hypothetical protein
MVRILTSNHSYASYTGDKQAVYVFQLRAGFQLDCVYSLLSVCQSGVPC